MLELYWSFTYSTFDVFFLVQIVKTFVQKCLLYDFCSIELVQKHSIFPNIMLAFARDKILFALGFKMHLD